MQNLQQNLDTLSAQLEAKYPTPLCIKTLQDQSIIDTTRWFELADIEYKSVDEQAEFDMLSERPDAYEIIETLAISENHLLTLVRMHIFINDLSPSELNTLTCVPTFHDQLEAHPSILFDEAFIETLIANNITTATHYNDLIEGYFAMHDLLNIDNYKPITDDVKKFIGLDLIDDLTKTFIDTITDEDTDEIMSFERTILLLSKGIVTERDLVNANHDDIMCALQNQLDNTIAVENYELARVLQTQIDNLK